MSGIIEDSAMPSRKDLDDMTESLNRALTAAEQTFAAKNVGVEGYYETSGPILWWAKDGATWRLGVGECVWEKASRANRVLLAIFLPELHKAVREAAVRMHNELEEAIEAAAKFAESTPTKGQEP